MIERPLDKIAVDRTRLEKDMGRNRQRERERERVRKRREREKRFWLKALTIEFFTSRVNLFFLSMSI